MEEVFVKVCDITDDLCLLFLSPVKEIIIENTRPAIF
jgi:hypothetical protein